MFGSEVEETVKDRESLHRICSAVGSLMHQESIHISTWTGRSSYHCIIMLTIIVRLKVISALHECDGAELRAFYRLSCAKAADACSVCLSTSASGQAIGPCGAEYFSRCIC